MSEQGIATSPVKVFYSYADADEKLCKKLETHLRMLHLEGLITELHKHQIVAGTNWRQTIDEHLSTASLILLLVSPDFFASDFCISFEMQKALERHEAGETRVIPIILRPTDWTNAPFAKLKCLPSNKKPVTDWRNRDKAYLDIAQGIRSAIDNLSTSIRSLLQRVSAPAEKSVKVHFNSIKSPNLGEKPDYGRDWCEYFEGEPQQKGHQTNDPDAWNTILLPDLKNLEWEVSQGTSCRLLQVKGVARLSPWFAFGFVFSEHAYTIAFHTLKEEVFRTDARANPDFRLFAPLGEEGEVLDSEGITVAVGISVTRSLEKDVRQYLEQRTENIAALLLLQSETSNLQASGDVVALAQQVKRSLYDFIRHRRAQRLLLFYLGPAFGACFIGHWLNAVCPEIQIMEDTQPGYVRSFLLKS